MCVLESESNQLTSPKYNLKVPILDLAFSIFLHAGWNIFTFIVLRFYLTAVVTVQITLNIM